MKPASTVALGFAMCLTACTTARAEAAQCSAAGRELAAQAADLGTLMRMPIDEGRHAGRSFPKPESVRLLATEPRHFDAARPNGDDLGGAAQSWGLGVQRFVDVGRAPGHGDRLVDGGGFTGFGPCGDAYALMASFALDPAGCHSMTVVLTGPGADPDTPPGRWSSRVRREEIALAALARRAALACADWPCGPLATRLHSTRL